MAEAYAYEVDNFTQRYSPLKDSREQMNLETNSRLADAAKKASKRSKGQCSSGDMEKAVNSQLGAVFVGAMETYAAESIKIDSHQPKKEHIYSHRTFAEKIMSFNMRTLAGLNSSVNLNGHYIGADKFGHFFDDGYDYLQISRKKSNYSEGVIEALKSGIAKEEGIFGLATTGIKSYGDLAANYSGFLFWTQLTEGANPYFRCNEGQWTQVREFDWADYVLPSWDEAINCSEYKDSNFADSIKRQATELELQIQKKHGKKYKIVCPAEPNECAKMNKLYGDKAKYILGPECLVIKKESSENQTAPAQKPSGISGLSEIAPRSNQQRGGKR